MPASRALPEPGEPPTAGAWSPCRTPSRSEAKRTAEDGRIGDTARSGERHSMERRTTLADARRPPASARPSAGAPAPDGHGHPLLRMRLLQPWSNLSGEGAGDAVCGPRAFFEFTGVPLGLGDQVPDAATPLKIRRGGAARSRMPRSPRRRAPLKMRRAREIQRPGSPWEGEGVPKRPSRRRLGRKTDCGKRSDRYEHH